MKTGTTTTRGYGYSRGTTHDRDMDALHKSTLRGSHSFKFGMELNLTDNVAFRAGYNYYSRMFKEEATLDQTGAFSGFRLPNYNRLYE